MKSRKTKIKEVTHLRLDAVSIQVTPKLVDSVPRNKLSKKNTGMININDSRARVIGVAAGLVAYMALCSDESNFLEYMPWIV